MKIQCACGAKFAFDVTPDMLQKPVRFVCPTCGLDSSEAVNELIRREFAGQTPNTPPPADVPTASTPQAPRLRISRAAPEPSAPVEEVAAAPPAQEHCAKHLRELAVDHCVVCGKPMCRQCMRLFGHVCSPLCRSKAEAQSIPVPVFAGQSALTEARYWRKAGAMGGFAAVLVVAALGFWIWYAWFGSVPNSIFSVRFDDRAYSGDARLCGTNQIVFLHGGTLARYDLKSGRAVWSDELVTKQQISDAVARESQSQPTDQFGQRIAQTKIEESVTRSLEERLRLHASGQSVWVSTPDKLTHYEWDSGKVLQDFPLANSAGEFIARGDEFLVMEASANGLTQVTHINAATGESRVEQLGQVGQTAIAQNATAANPPASGLPLKPGTEPMNPARVAEQAQGLSTAGRMALPALLANSSEQERIAAEINEQDQTHPGAQAPAHPAKPAQDQTETFTIVASPVSFIQVAIRLLESHIVAREAMKGPGKSALDGNLSTANTTAAANETLNEMQRERGGGTVTEDESRYQVSLRRPESTGDADWTGEVIGPPALFPLKSVNVLAAGKTLIVFDKTNKKLWQATLTYNVSGGVRGANGEPAPFGDGPCVERGDTLYVFDQAVLTAFDLATGNARWRLPSVGVVGLFFDDHGMLYVNTTTADPETIKYSRQIDISQKIEVILLKIDPQTGRTLWSIKPGGFIAYLSGKFIYTVQFYDPGDEEGSAAGIQLPAYLKIRRISPSDGRVLWEVNQDRAPLAVQFQHNFIELVFKKEVQVLKFLSL